MQTTAVAFTGQDQVEVSDFELEPLKPNELLVQTSRTLISTGTECIVLQRKFAEGTHWANWVKYPFRAGYSNVGLVTQVGAEVKDFRVGDRVFSRTGHATVVKADAARAVLIPRGVSDDEASFAALAKIVQHGVRKAKIELGETVVVIGVGPLGQLTVQYARLCGAGQVIAIDPAKKRLKLAAGHGATHTLDEPLDKAADAIGQITGGRKPDVVFDMTGHPNVFNAALSLPRKYGRVVLIGDTGTPNLQTLTHHLVTQDLSIIGAHDGGAPQEETPLTPWTNRRMIELFFQLVADKRMNVADLITHRYPLTKAPAAFEMLTTRRDEAMGVVFEY